MAYNFLLYLTHMIRSSSILLHVYAIVLFASICEIVDHRYTEKWHIKV